MRAFPAALIALVIFLVQPFDGSEKLEADHGVVRCGNVGVKACIAAASPFVTKYAKPANEFTYCINSRGMQYPGFQSQTRNVMAAWADSLRMTAREVAYPSNSTSLDCIVRNDMRDAHPCSGCGAWVYTQNMPVLIEYNARTGYLRWDSTLAHEYGHMLCLLDEHYDKAGFRSFILTFGYWIHGSPTSMDSGTPYLAAYSPLGIAAPTEYDLDRCEETLGRDLDALPVCDPCWDGTWWIFGDGWAVNPATNEWRTPYGWIEWKDCTRWSATAWGCWHPLSGRWIAGGSSLYSPAYDLWTSPPLP